MPEKTKEKKRNYWLITSEYPPSYGGGIGTYCYHNATMLAENGWEVTVFVAARNKERDTVAVKNGIRIVEFHINRSGVWNFLGYDTALSHDFATIIKTYLETEGVPEILESQEYSGIAYFILLYKHLHYHLFSDLKVLLTLHAPSFLYNDYNRVPSHQLPYFWIGEMERWCIKAADMINSPSEFMRNAIQSYFSTPLNKPIKTIPYPYKKIASQVNFERDPRDQWFFFGKLTPQKGIIPLLVTFRKLWSSGWQLPLKLIGGGDHFYHPENISMLEWIKRKYAAEIKNNNLQLLGSLPPAEWTRVTREGCVVLIPSIGDNYPFTVMESLENGQIVLASASGGQSELIRHGENGFLFDHGKKGDLEEKIREINALGIAQINEIRKAAIQTVMAIHNYAQVYNQKLGLINEMMSADETSRIFPFTRDFPIERNLDSAGDDKTKLLLSVVIPYYNMGHLIEETLQSVYASDYGEIEVIVVNDGSDTAQQIKIESLQQQYGFTLVSQENKGLSEARNTGAGLATGEFLAFLDADDKIHPSYYTKAIDVLKEKDNVFFVGSWVQYFENSQGIWPSFIPEPPYLLYFNMVCGGGLVYKTRAFLQAGFNDSILEYGLEDWDSVISMVKNGWRGVVIPEPLYMYRIRKGSIVRMFTKEKILYSISHITGKHLSIYSTFAADLTGLLQANGPGYKISNPTLDYERFGWLTGKFPFLRKPMAFAKRNAFTRRIVFRVMALIKDKAK